MTCYRERYYTSGTVVREAQASTNFGALRAHMKYERTDIGRICVGVGEQGESFVDMKSRGFAAIVELPRENRENQVLTSVIFIGASARVDTLHFLNRR